MDAAISGMWEYVVQIHQTADINGLVVFYGVVTGGLCFLALELLHARTRAVARRAQERTRNVEDKLDELRRLERRISARFDEKDEALRDRIEQAEYKFADRVDRKTEGLTSRVTNVEQECQDVLREMESFRQRVSSVESRIPDIYDHLEEFRSTLARIFRGELSTVLDSFDSSVAAVLDHMKDQLRMGINRIEGIESMVRSRQKAERALLGPSDEEWEITVADDEPVDAVLKEPQLEDAAEEEQEEEKEEVKAAAADEEETTEYEPPEAVEEEIELKVEDEEGEDVEQPDESEEEEAEVVDQMVAEMEEEDEPAAEEEKADEKGEKYSNAA